MLVTFRSKASANVMMYERDAKRILDMFGKDVQRGVITAAETCAIIDVLEAAMTDSKAHSVSDEVRHDIETQSARKGEFEAHEAVPMVAFAARAFPLLAMLRAARANDHDILWGV